MATKRRGRTISLRGAAARAFVEMSAGRPAKSEDDVLVRLATLVHMHVTNGDMPTAVSLLKTAMAQARVDARKECSGDKAHVEQASNETVQET